MIRCSCSSHNRINCPCMFYFYELLLSRGITRKLGPRRFSGETRSNLCEGEIISMERTFTLQDVHSFRELCRLTNRSLAQDASAKLTASPSIIVPEILYAGLFPTIIGTHFPGSIYVSQKLEFRESALVGESLLAQVKANSFRRVRDKHSIFKLVPLTKIPFFGCKTNVCCSYTIDDTTKMASTTKNVSRALGKHSKDGNICITDCSWCPEWSPRKR